MEVLRTSSIEHDRGRELAVSGSLEQRGGSLQHERRDRERREFDGLANHDFSAAIGECRRQEEAERAGQLARAWAEAEHARDDAEQARLEAVGARNELRSTTRALERLQQASARDPAAPADAPYAELPTLTADPDDATLDDAPAPFDPVTQLDEPAPSMIAADPGAPSQ